MGELYLACRDGEQFQEEVATKVIHRDTETSLAFISLATEG